MEIRAIAIDEDVKALTVLKQYCRQARFIELAKTFTKWPDAKSYIQHNRIDLLFCDIHPWLGKTLQLREALPPGCLVVFVTDKAEHAVEAFDMKAVDYIVKPFAAKRFAEAAEKTILKYDIMQRQPQEENDIVLRADYELVKVPVSKIRYIEGLDDYVRIYLHNQKPVITRMTMKCMEEKLSRKNFARVHRSYIVPVDKIDYVRNKTVYIENRPIPLGICYEEKFYRLIDPARYA